MEFGLGLMGYPGCWEDAAFAERHGFSTAGFVDSPAIAGDPFACMAVAAQTTSTLRIGTLLNVPSLRSAPTTASGIAMINHLAPGRVFFGTGTGYTGRMPLGYRSPIAATKVRDYARSVRDLLAGEVSANRIGTQDMPIALRYQDGLRVEDAGEIPIYFAAEGPQALEAAGAVADGVISALVGSSVMGNGPEVFAEKFAQLRSIGAGYGRNLDDAYMIFNNVICVLEPGESAISPRVLARCGPQALIAFHSYACNHELAAILPPFIRDRIAIYEKEVLSRFDLPREQLYREVHAGHLSYLLDGEAAVLTEEIIKATTMTGTAEEIVAKLTALEAHGLKNATFWAPRRSQREMIVEVAEKIMPLMAENRATSGAAEALLGTGAGR